jgi:hypothetical protein
VMSRLIGPLGPLWWMPKVVLASGVADSPKPTATIMQMTAMGQPRRLDVRHATDRFSQRSRRSVAAAAGRRSRSSTNTSPDHSMTSASPTRIARGSASLSAFAVFKLTTSSNFVGCSTGRSAGFVP